MLEPYLDAADDRELVCVGLPAAQVAALAGVLERLGNDGGMTDFPSVAALTAIELVIKKKPATQSDSGEHKQEVVQVAGYSEQVLGDGGGIGIVLDKDFQAGVRREHLPEGDIAPVQVGSKDQDAFF